MSDDRSKESGQADSAESKVDATSWDPYEVWRTRVLLPRLEDRSGAAAAEQARAETESRREPRRLTATG